MATITRMTRSLSLDRAIFQEVERTRGSVSTSERVNELLKAGLAMERRKLLDREAAAFFEQTSSRTDADADDAFRAAAMASMIADPE